MTHKLCPQGNLWGLFYALSALAVKDPVLWARSSLYRKRFFSDSDSHVFKKKSRNFILRGKMKKVSTLAMVGMLASSFCSAMESDGKMRPLCTMTREMTVSYPPSQLGGRNIITQEWPTIWYTNISVETLGNKNGLILCQKLRCKSLKNNFFVHAADDTAVVRDGDNTVVKSSQRLEPIVESDPAFVACCQPDEEGKFSQLDVHDGCIVCETVQPVIVRDEPVAPGSTIPVVKKYGASCENSGVIELKKVFVLVAAEMFVHKNR